MNIEEIRELINLVVETGVAELEVERSGNRVRIRRGATATDIILPPGTSSAPLPAGANAPSPSSPAAAPLASPPAAPLTNVPEANLITVKSPIVGTYYDSPSPGTASFVKVGDTVQPGQVLCIIESMKLMNEIEAEVSGTVVSKLVENGRPVEYGESLFTVRPR